MEVIAKAISETGELIGYYLEGDEETTYTLDEIIKMISSGKVEPFEEKELFVIENVSIPWDTTDVNNISKACIDIRRLASLGRVKVDASVHRSGINRHLFPYLEYCGVTPEEFIKLHLSRLQPYQVRVNQKQQYSEEIICVIEDVYAVALYITVCKVHFQELIVSFHEDHRLGIANTQRGRVYAKTVPVIADSVMCRYDKTNKYGIKFTVQRGLAQVTVSAVGERIGKYYIVHYDQIEDKLLDTVNGFVTNLNTLNSDDALRYFTRTYDISFSSYANDPASTISIMVDTFLAHPDSGYRRTVDSVMCMYVSSIQLSEQEASRLYETLKERYRITCSPNVQPLLTRVRTLLKNVSEVPTVSLENTDKVLRQLPQAVQNMYKNDPEGLRTMLGNTWDLYK